MKAIKLIREQGLKHRMEAPELFMTRVNRLCIELTHTRAKEDGQRQKKVTLRKMDRVVGTVSAHARRYRKLLDEQWEQTEWTRAQARSPDQLKERGRSWKFKHLQKRRSQTEGRVAILKNVFIGQSMRSKGFKHRELTVSWVVLTHNLWVMARMALAAQARQKLAA